jgi:hypothetical protein
MPRCISLSAFALSAVAVVLISGCGSSETGDSSTTRGVSAGQAAAHRKLLKLRTQLHRRKRALRAQRAREADESEQASSRRASASSVSGDFAALENELDGEVGAVIGSPGSAQAESFGNLSSGSAWSTSKVPIALKLLQDVGGPSGLSVTQVEEMRRALTLSDNEAAAALFADLEHKHGGIAGASAAVGEVLREAGDSSTQISTQGRDGFSTYGQTEWSLTNQQQFISALAAGCIGTQESREYVLNLMGEVSADTWGLGSAGLPARWKGGWGPGVDGRYLVRQMGILYVGDREAAVTLAAIPSNGQFETAEEMATNIAQWLAKRARTVAARSRGC